MQTLGSLPPDASRSARLWRVVQPVVLILTMLGMGYVIVQVVLQSPSQQLARAARAFNVIASARPGQADMIKAVDAVGVFDVTGEPVVSDEFIFTFRTAFNGWQWLHYEIHRSTGIGKSPEPALIGEMRFKDNHWLSGRNLVTGKEYPAETSAPQQTPTVSRAGVE